MLAVLEAPNPANAMSKIVRTSVFTAQAHYDYNFIDLLLQYKL
jgi:hypothetical protein